MKVCVNCGRALPNLRPQINRNIITRRSRPRPSSFTPITAIYPSEATVEKKETHTVPASTARVMSGIDPARSFFTGTPRTVHPGASELTPLSAAVPGGKTGANAPAGAPTVAAPKMSAPSEGLVPLTPLKKNGNTGGTTPKIPRPLMLIKPNSRAGHNTGVSGRNAHGTAVNSAGMTTLTTTVAQKAPVSATSSGTRVSTEVNRRIRRLQAAGSTRSAAAGGTTGISSGYTAHRTVEQPSDSGLHPATHGSRAPRDPFEKQMEEAIGILRTAFLPAAGPVRKTEKKKIQPVAETVRPVKIPDSLVEILVGLSELDLNIEASAIVRIRHDEKNHGDKVEILASAISKRISDSLIAMIVGTLGNIGQDIIASLDSGDLKYISIYGTKGILFMAPVMKDIYLLLHTGPDAKSGVINIAKIRVKKQLELFFAKKNLDKTPL